jgi:protein involved in polysaccharide export with SLBB domain
LNLAILAAFGLQADAVFGQVFNGLQKQGGVARSANGPHHFTIMGHIARPNCYEALITTPLLVDVVKLAGGLTPTAGGPIRIVRDGRTVRATLSSSTEN